MAILWFAPLATIEVGTLIAAVSSSATLDSQMASEQDMSSVVKDLKISGGERDAEAAKFLGYNELLDEKRSGLMTVTFTMAFQGGSATAGKDPAEWWMGTKQTVTGNYVRATGGEKASNDRVKKAVLLKLTNGTNNISILLNNALCTGVEKSLAADGHMEETVTFKCLASNYYEEDDFA